ncbi:sarcosine oxidase subunit alpha family protein [Nordella sp. HKS 07]|uniref:sarcosine oxidase subunit alpha family protein n=1 Tax=Nordella sp. HKS 07 TaxID=2712222 RepID=UPI0013E11BA5|nr:sarcosine oxidase subunit alpha family protein [Nordella sp. HKS 07]QIG47509.1 sarcosine oxidase subunit alpha family protein [Nordella sp. HKS 07]
MAGFRLAKGGLIDRGTTLNFTFDGKSFSGHQGDTLASALIANGVHLMGRSFKYHRPRGVIAGGAAEPNALVELRDGARKEANTRATVIELYDGLSARSQNRWPSLNFDIGAINSLAASVFVAGFYYKTFMWPKSFWEKIYEPLIRRAAGLGAATHEADPDKYEKSYGHCDLLVIGAGPAGLSAALTAARAGARVILLDEGSRLGGSLLHENEEIGGQSGFNWAQGAIAELGGLANVTLMPRTTAFGAYDGNVFGALERVNDHVLTPSPYEPRQRYWKIMAKRCVLAAGAEERPIVFGGNDVPGVMLASAMRGFANRYATASGSSVVVFTNNDSGYRTARDLKAKGVHVEVIVDSRKDSAADAAGIPVLKGRTVTDAETGKIVSGVELSDHTHIACDTVAMSGGWSPVVNLLCHKGAKPRWNDRLQAFLPPNGDAQLAAAGSANGAMLLSEVLREGAEKAAKAVSDLGFTAKTDIPTCRDEAYSIQPLWWVKESHGKAFVDYQNDVTPKDLPLAAREGYSSIELAKRYTTAGMATDQGKLGNVNAIAILAEAAGKSIAEIGTTTFRPFYTPVPFAAFAGPFKGHHFMPTRKTPLHDWAEEQGAVFVETGLWLRSSWFPLPHESGWLDPVIREVKAAREKVGICDVSTLGKIDVQGPDAAEFLNRLYCNGFAQLEVGKARYGLMLREDGVVMDDGTTSRLAADHFFMTTTTANAAKIMTHMEFCHQALWPELDVQYVSVSEQWAQMAVAGPKARPTLQKIVDDVTLDDTTFPYLAAKEIRILGGITARLFRISFSGEHAYELSVPADYGNLVARAIMQAGEEFGITPYGVEALSVMRIEKGHVAGGELNGTTTADDLGLGRMMSTKKDYIGRMMAGREGMVAKDRQVVVGIRPVDKADRIRSGSHLLKRDDQPSLAGSQGYITSVAYSPTLGYWLGLALCQNGRQRHGEIVKVFDGIRNIHMYAEICDPMHYDKENKKLHA